MQIDYTLTAEQENLKQRAHDFAMGLKPFVAEWDEIDRCPMNEVVDAARKAGLLGLTMPKEYGGQDLTAVDYVIAHEESVRTCQWATPSEAMFGTSGPGPSICVRSDNEALKQKFLADMVTGRKRCAITMTEPKYGSNVNDLETSAEDKGDHFVVNGSKRFITGAIDNELYATFVRFNNVPGSRGIGSIMIEKGSPGVTILEGPKFVGSRGQRHGELFFENARIPKENLMFKEGSFARMMEPFNMERLHNAVGALAKAEAAFDEAVKYTQTRKAFGKFISEFQSVYHDLAEMWISLEAARGLCYRAACTAVGGKYPKLMDVTAAKVFSNEVALKVT
ncbi:MAG: acyl-CoA dehydrogenase family protein, partial [Dehalococcoidia bacterium]|nr:acyl-CoA dehydrogenase family protein [Dehalococcoidia bacterium]